MNAHSRTRLLASGWLALALCGQAAADSFTSSASSAGSASVGSLSDSLTGSSNASSAAVQVAEGPYRVVEVAALAQRPDMLRLHLQPAAQTTAQGGQAGALWLTLPRQALAARPLVQGDLVQASHRPYGLAFARLHPADASTHAVAGPTSPAAPFFLVLADGWHRGLAPRALAL